MQEVAVDMVQKAEAEEATDIFTKVFKFLCIFNLICLSA